MSTVSVAGVEVDTRHWIGGSRVESADTFEDVSPLDGQVVAHVSRGGATEVDQAVAAASEAFPAWARLPVAERAEILGRVADGVEARIEDLAQVETRDNGSLLRSHRRGVMPRVAMNIRFFAQHLLTLEHPDFDTRGHRNHVSWDPAGPTAIVTPWNAPLMLATWRIGPALAAGNTVVAKPPEWAPLTASLFADIAHEAGLPPGVFNVVQGMGAEAGAPLVAHPGIRRICFTGSVPTAVKIGEAAARNVTPVSFELGGKSPLLVFDDADLDLAVGLAVEQFDNSGQVCLAAVRMLVQDGIYDEFRARFLERAAAVRQADSRDETVDIGPLVSRTHLERVEGFVKRAVADGAQVVLGGEPNHELNNATGGFYYRPTVFEGVDRAMEITCQEVFGPVLTLQRFSSEDVGVAMANDTEYGLAATIVTGDRERAERVSAQVRAGTVWVNCFFVRDLSAPFGGERPVRDRPGGRRLVVRLLLRREELGLRPERLELTWERSSGRACSRMCPRSCCRPRRGESSTVARRSTLVPALRQLRADVFEQLDYDTVVVLDSHWATTVEFVVTAQDRRAGLFTSEELPRGMCRMPYDFPGDPELASRWRSRSLTSTAPGSPRSTTRTCRCTTQRSTSGSSWGRGSTSAGCRSASARPASSRTFCARDARSATRSPPRTAGCCSSRPARCRTRSGSCASCATTRPATRRTSARRRPAPPTWSGSAGSGRATTRACSTPWTSSCATARRRCSRTT